MPKHDDFALYFESRLEEGKTFLFASSMRFDAMTH